MIKLKSVLEVNFKFFRGVALEKIILFFSEPQVTMIYNRVTLVKIGAEKNFVSHWMIKKYILHYRNHLLICIFKTICLKIHTVLDMQNRRRVASHLFVFHFKIIVKQLEAPLSFSTSNDNLLSSKIMREYSSPSLEYYLLKILIMINIFKGCILTMETF